MTEHRPEIQKAYSDPEADAQARKKQAMKMSLRYYCKAAPLYIKTKAGEIIPLEFNASQKIAHDAIEKMKRETGRVRVLILKGRQQGISTYTAARFYHKTATQKARNTFILTHEGKATTNLFDMVKLYWEHSNGNVRPTKEKDNQAKMTFERRRSQYQVGTAGTGSVGRSGTNQYFHGSEVHFWENTAEIQTGIMQTVPDLPGTEIILESTGNGMSGMFYNMCINALKGIGEYRLIFLPWFKHEEYIAEVPEDFAMTEEEREYFDTYRKDGLTELGQIVWRRNKIESFNTAGEDGEWKFKQEYPACPEEAFQTSGESLFPAKHVQKAKACDVTDEHAPLILGVDPARAGEKEGSKKKRDRISMCIRRGREVPVYYTIEEETDVMQLVGKIIKLNRRHPFDMIFVDTTNSTAVVDRLKELGYENVRGIHFGEKATDPSRYLNKRAEMYGDAKKWLKDGPVSVPDTNEFSTDLAVIPAFETTSNGRNKLMDKKKIRKDYGISPDIADSFVLTFAYPVKKKEIHDIHRLNMAHQANRDAGISVMQKWDQDGRSNNQNPGVISTLSRWEK